MPPSLISPLTTQRKPAYENLSFSYVMEGAESEQPVEVLFYQWVGCRDVEDSFAFLTLGVSGLRMDQFIYVETRENVFFIIWDH